MVKEEPRERSNGNVKDKDEQYRKLFVGGLSLQMTEEDLRAFYSQYGNITDCVVMKDPHTRRSRGFGFVTFTSMDEIDKAMNARPHVIQDKTIDPKRAVPREASQKNEANMSTKRLYVSGVRDDHNEKAFEEYFSKYGGVDKVEIIKDKSTGKYRGFAFISFDDYDPVDKCCLERQHMILNHRCDVKKALSKEEIAKAQQMDRDRAERGSRSRGNVRGSGQWNENRMEERGGAWGAPQPWGHPSGGYPGYYGPPASGGWGEPAAASWAPPAATGGWQAPPAAGAAPWQGGGNYPQSAAGAYPPSGSYPPGPAGAYQQGAVDAYSQGVSAGYSQGAAGGYSQRGSSAQQWPAGSQSSGWSSQQNPRY
uniref:RRM domain-containing protein n=1 Tax=Panagrolaimus superbus TaxID=310955 RepID=A0A914YJ72_9BILA